MNAELGLERCHRYLNSHLRSASSERNWSEPERPRWGVAISRQAGCGALAVAEKLAEYLQNRTPKDAPPWTVFDRNLVEKVLEDHQLPKHLAKFMPENWISEIKDTMDQLFGLHPPSWILVRQTAETILRLTKLGNVIIIGRGANVITARLKHIFHVRLVASLTKRVERIQENDQLDRKAALAFIRREDVGRKRYLKKHYQKDIEDPLFYHLVINTDLVPYEKAARIIGDAMMDGMQASGNQPKSVKAISG